MANRGEKVEVVTDFLFLGSEISGDDDCSHEIRRWLLLGKKAMTNLDSVLKSRDITLPAKIRIVKAMAIVKTTRLPSGHVWLWDLDCKEGRMSKNWCLQTVVLEKTSESPLDSKEIKPANLKGNQPWILIGRTDAKAETPEFWSSDANSWLSGKVPDAGKDWGHKEKTALEDETAEWYHWCNGHELGQTLGAGEGQGRLACCSPWGHKESDMSGQLNNNNWFTLLC